MRASYFALCAALAACGGGGGGTPDGAIPPPDGAAEPDGAPPAPPDAAPPDAGPDFPGANCNRAIELEAGGEPVAGSSSGAGNDELGTCSLGTASSPDAVYLVDLGDGARDLIVSATVDEAAERPYDAVLYARTECEKQSTQIACSDSGWSEQLEILGASGQVFVLVDGTAQYGGDNDGDFTIAAAVREIAAAEADCDPAGVTSRCGAELRCVDGACAADSAELGCAQAIDLAGGADVTGATFAFNGDWYRGSCAGDVDLAAGEQIYRIEVAATSDLVASTDHPETRFDTYLYLRRDDCGGEEIACADDVDLDAHDLKTTLEVPALAPGTYYLFVDGSSAFPKSGPYRLTLALTPVE